MLRLEKICKDYGGKTLFLEVDLAVNSGEKIGFIGPNGTGKTTLFRIIEGSEEADQGHVRLVGGVRVGTLRQELAASNRSLLLETLEGDVELVRLRGEHQTIHEQLHHPVADATSLTNRLGVIEHRLEEIGSFTAESRAGAILLGLGFKNEDLDRPLDTFSGGWRMRVALARLLFSRADLLLLDEPTNHLDLESVAWLETHLARMIGTFVIISHDRGFLNRVTRVTVAIEGKQLVRYAGSFDYYLVQREEKIQLLQKSAAKQTREMAELEKFINRFRAKATKARQVQSRVKRLDKIVPVQIQEAQRTLSTIRLPQPPPCARDVLAIRGLQKGYGSVTLFRNVNLLLERGGKVGLLGPNGVGKTSFLKIVASTLSPDKGSVVFGDRVKVAHYAQHALESLNPEDSILESASRVAGVGVTENAVRSVLGGFLFSGEEVRPKVAVLSGGEKARLAMARLFLTGANVLLLDEPTNHLDMGARAALEEALSSYAGTLILVTHDRDLMEEACDRYWVIGNSAITPWEGSLADYLEQATESNKKTDSSGQPSPDRRGQRDLRRETARVREACQQTIRKEKKRLTELEMAIQRMEEEHAHIQHLLADPAIHQGADKSALTSLLTKNGGLEVELAKAMSEWEGISLVVEAQEEAARKAIQTLRGSP